MWVAFRDEVSLVETPGEQVRLETPWARVIVSAPGPGLVAALRTLATGHATADELADLVLAQDEDPAALYYQLRRCADLRLLCYSVVAAGGPLATLVPMAPGFELLASPVDARARFRLSRFAYCRRDADAIVVESPLSATRTTLNPAGVALVAALAQPRTAQELAKRVDGLTEDDAAAFLGLLASARLAAAVTDGGELDEDRQAPLAQWDFHDLLFHTRSRQGRHDYPYGGTFRSLGTFDPLPAVKPRMAEDVVALYRPPLDQLAREDVSLTRALETRRSIREYGDPPISVRQLGEFLYRVAAVRQLTEPDRARDRHYTISRRAYPSAGAAHDLELYLTVNGCVGLAPGLYHYDPLEHQLGRLTGPNAETEGLLRDARQAALMASPPQVLVTIASRFQRLSWKYTSMAYAATLKNVGVLYQTMYLVATAMGLAPCALGGGNADRFAAAVGSDYFAESSVGEFILGSAPPP